MGVPEEHQIKRKILALKLALSRLDFSIILDLNKLLRFLNLSRVRVDKNFTYLITYLLFIYYLFIYLFIYFLLIELLWFFLWTTYHPLPQSNPCHHLSTKWVSTLVIFSHVNVSWKMFLCTLTRHLSDGGEDLGSLVPPLSLCYF